MTRVRRGKWVYPRESAEVRERGGKRQGKGYRGEILGSEPFIRLRKFGGGRRASQGQRPIPRVCITRDECVTAGKGLKGPK